MADATILSLVLYLPVAGMLAIAALPAGRDGAGARVHARGHGRAVPALARPLRALRPGRARPAGRHARAVDPGVGRELHHRAGRLQHPARHPHHLPGPAGDGRRLQRHHEGGEALLRDGVPHPVRDAGHLRRAGSLRVLPLLGGDADPDVPHHRHLGRRAAHLRDAQVLPLHRLRQHPHARRGDLPGVLAVAHDGHHLVRLRRPLQDAAAARGAAVAARRLRALLRDQGADGAVPHLAARRARRGAHRRLRDPRGRAPQDGDVRLHEAGLPALPRRDAARHAAHSPRSPW